MKAAWLLVMLTVATATASPPVVQEPPPPDEAMQAFATIDDALAQGFGTGEPRLVAAVQVAGLGLALHYRFPDRDAMDVLVVAADGQFWVSSIQPLMQGGSGLDGGPTEIEVTGARLRVVPITGGFGVALEVGTRTRSCPKTRTACNAWWPAISRITCDGARSCRLDERLLSRPEAVR